MAASGRKTAMLLGAAGLVLLGVGVGALGLSTRDPELKSDAFAFLSNDPRPSITAHNSPAAAVDPQRPLSMAVADKHDTPVIGCTVWSSVNGGDNWTPLDIALAEPDTACYWPDVGFDHDGNLLVLFTAMGQDFNEARGVYLQAFSGGQPSGSPVAVTGPNAFHARMAIDGDRVLVTWVRVDSAVPFQAGSSQGSRVELAVSEDLGRSFGEPVTVSKPGQLLLQPTVLVGNGGEVVVGALDLGADLLDYESQHNGVGGLPDDGQGQVVTYTSTDGGATFADRTAAGDIQPAKRIYPDVSAPTPGFALDAATGRLYATWESGRGDGRDVFLAWSDDAGRTWGQPIQFGRTGAQTLPTVGVAGDGRVDLLFYDGSADPTDVRTEPVLASSWDEGRTFTSRSVSGRTFDSRIGFGSFQNMSSLGQQLAVISQDDRALTFWSDTRKGTMDDNNQELAHAHIEIDEGRGRRPLLVAAGGLIVVAGLAVALASRQASAKPKSR